MKRRILLKRFETVVMRSGQQEVGVVVVDLPQLPQKSA